MRRRSAAPLGLLLLGWALGAGPLAHAVLAHGEPLLHDDAERGWVGHVEPEHTQRPLPRETRPPHHHSPGGLEHLQLAFSAPLVCLLVAAVLLQARTRTLPVWPPPLLSRWRLPEVPGAP
ncbi:MAG: hypothetical protein ACLQDQ_17795 [Myxococcaceae bacterium]